MRLCSPRMYPFIFYYLKMESVRLRKLAVRDTVTSTPTTIEAQQAPAIPPVAYIIIAIILGFVLGKFIL